MNPKISWKYVYEDLRRKYPDFVKQHRVRWADCKPDYSTTMTITFVTADGYRYKYDIYGNPPKFLEDLSPGRIKLRKNCQIHIRMSDMERRYIEDQAASVEARNIAEYFRYAYEHEYFGDAAHTSFDGIRNKIVNIRVTAEDAARLNNKAMDAGVNISTYVRNMLLNNSSNPYQDYE